MRFLNPKTNFAFVAKNSNKMNYTLIGHVNLHSDYSNWRAGECTNGGSYGFNTKIAVLRRANGKGAFVTVKYLSTTADVGYTWDGQWVSNPGEIRFTDVNTFGGLFSLSCVGESYIIPLHEFVTVRFFSSVEDIDREYGVDVRNTIRPHILLSQERREAVLSLLEN